MVRSSKEGEPWVICIREQLSLIGTDPYPLTDNYILAEDLDLVGGELSPIGDESSSFTGTFDGNGRRITNFQIPAGADAVVGYLPLGSYDENAVFTNISGAMTPQEVCGQLAPRPPGTAPILMNPHEEGGGNRLICQADQLTDTNAYIRTRAGLGQRYLLIRDVTLSGNFTPIGTSAVPFAGTFNLGGKTITGLSVQASADSVTDRPLFGAYTPSPERFIGYPVVNAEDICDILTGMTAMVAPILYNPHESGGNRLICQGNQLSDTAAYIRTTIGLGQRYLLVSDVTLSGNFTPIGGSITGTFDGGGHTVSGLMISSANANLGFFGQIGSGGVVKNLNFQDPNVSFTGTVAANIGVLAGELSGRIEKVNVTGASSRVSGNTFNSMNQNIGGLVGRQTGGTIINSATSSEVSRGGNLDDNIGGLVGSQSGGTITSSTASGDVFRGAAGNDNIGGLVGQQSGSGTIENSEAHGDVSNGGVESAIDSGDKMGGLVGQNSGTIRGSTASGNVSDGGSPPGAAGSNDHMGGLVGRQSGGTITSSIAMGDVSNGGGGHDSIGGLLGYQDFGTLENSTASGDVSNGGNDNDYMGGLVGQQHGGTTRNSIASGDVSDGGNGNDLMGGLVGRQLNGLTQNSLSLGSVSNGGGGTNELGGLVGLISSSTRTNLYWNTQTSGLTTPLGSGTCASPNCASRETSTLTQATSLTGLNTPASMPTAGPWNFGTTSQYPGLTFTSGDQTCTLRPVLTSAASTSTTTAAEFEICPDAEDADSFHPTCRAKPTGCPN